MLGDGQPFGVEESGGLLELLRGRAADGAEGERGRHQVARRGQEEVVRLVRVDRRGVRRADLGRSFERLAEPLTVLVGQDVKPVADVVEFVEQEVILRRAQAAERLAVGGLEEDVECAAAFEEAFEVGRDQGAGGVGLAAGGPVGPEGDEEPLALEVDLGVVGHLDLDQLAVASEEGLARVERFATGDDVALEAGREVAKGADAHVVRRPFEDDRGAVERGVLEPTP